MAKGYRINWPFQVAMAENLCDASPSLLETFFVVMHFRFACPASWVGHHLQWIESLKALAEPIVSTTVATLSRFSDLCPFWDSL